MKVTAPRIKLAYNNVNPQETKGSGIPGILEFVGGAAVASAVQEEAAPKAEASETKSPQNTPIIVENVGSGTGEVTKGASTKVTKLVDEILDDATSGRATKGRATQFEKSGGYNKALDDFNNMGLSDVKDIPSGKVGKLPDGRTVNVRTKSSDGRPTLEIFDGKKSTKIRYRD